MTPFIISRKTAQLAIQATISLNQRLDFTDSHCPHPYEPVNVERARGRIEQDILGSMAYLARYFSPTAVAITDVNQQLSAILQGELLDLIPLEPESTCCEQFFSNVAQELIEWVKSFPDWHFQTHLSDDGVAFIQFDSTI